MTSDAVSSTHFSQEKTSTSLVRNVVDGNQDAWARFVSIYAPFLYRICRKSRLSEHDSADIVQEVMLRVHNSVAGLERGKPGTGLRLWLRKIAKNVILDHVNEINRHRELKGLAGIPVTIDILPKFDDEESISNAVPLASVLAVQQMLETIRNEYEPRTVQAFLRTTRDGVPAVDVAAELGMTAGNVRQAKYKIRRRLKEFAGGPS